MPVDWKEVNERRIEEKAQELLLYCSHGKEEMTPRAFELARISLSNLLDNIAERDPIFRTENGWQYWLKRFCPYPWFNLAKAGAEYAILLAWPEY